MVISLIEFIQTGNFGPLRVGSTRMEAIDAFGNPEAEGPVIRGRSAFFRYGSACLWWKTEATDVLKFFSVEFPEKDNSPNPLSLEFLQPGMTVDQTIKFLNERRIAFRVQKPRIKLDFTQLYAGVGVRLAFNNNNEPGWRKGLIGVEYAPDYLRP
jgi:hypothetical protein